MSTFDLANATLLYGSITCFAYNIPALSQALIIAILSLLWLTCLPTALSVACGNIDRSTSQRRRLHKASLALRCP